MRRVLVLLLCVAASGCSDPPPPVDMVKPELTEAAENYRDRVIGRWYGEADTKDGGRRMHLVERHPDGTMKIRFRLVSANGAVREQVESLFWGVSGPIYFTIFRGSLHGEKFEPADATQAYNYDAYEILGLGAVRFRYRHVATGNEFTVERVGPEFRFPD